MAITNTNSSRGIDNNTNAEELVVFQANADELGISGGGSSKLTSTVSLTAAEVIDLVTTSKTRTLVPTPDSGKAIKVLSYRIYFPFNTTVYDALNGSVIWLQFEGEAGTDVSTNIIGSAIDIEGSADLNTVNTVTFQNLVPNKGINLKVHDAQTLNSNGDSPLSVSMDYEIVDVAI